MNPILLSGDDEQKKESRMFFHSVEDLQDAEIRLQLREVREAQPAKKRLPAYYFDICLPDGTKIGNCDLRIGHNENTHIGGNIGYGIYPKWRGHHYAAKACALLFRQARKHGMDSLIITCDPGNRASARTCEIAGGEYIQRRFLRIMKCTRRENARL